MAMIERDDRELVVCPRCNGDMSMPATRAAIFCHDPVPAVRSLLSKPSPLTDDEWIRKQAAEEDGCFVGAGSPSTGNPLIQIPNCPKCGNPLEKVRQSSNSPLNEEQFDSVRAGDWFCKCHSNERGNKPWAYFWDSEVLQSETSSTIEDKVHAIMTAGVGDVGVDHFYGKQVATQADLLHQADGDDFPEPHMEAQPEPEDSPELAQSVAKGEPDCTCGATKGMDWGCHAMECPVHQYHLNYPTAARRLVESWKSPAQETEFTPLKDRQSALIERLLTRKGTSEHQGQPHAGLQYALDECIDLEEKLLESIRTISQLRSQLRNWETWGTVEIALRNPNVDSYMKHWEGRALAAEEKVVELEGRIANALL